jgi:hypothetical protein
MTARRRTRRAAAKAAHGPPAARIPLPRKGQKKHRDLKRYDRRAEKRTLREETANFPR